MSDEVTGHKITITNVDIWNIRRVLRKEIKKYDEDGKEWEVEALADTLQTFQEQTIDVENRV